MPVHQTEITTIDELLALPEDGMRHELLDAVHVVTPSPAVPHQQILLALIRAMDRALGNPDDAELLISPADVRLGPDTLVQPDLFVVAKEPGARLAAWSDVGVPILAIEILSPSTAARDRGAKRRIYQRAGVREYWIVDLDVRIVERWQPSDVRPEILDGAFEWIMADGTAFSFDSVDFFKSLPVKD